ncbi:Altered inheritance of mitochondria protein 24, mitochondrial [Rhizina undulata]
MAARRVDSLFRASARPIIRPAGTAPIASRILLYRYSAFRNVHIRATPSTSSLDGPVDLSEQTQAIPKLSGAGPFPAGMSEMHFSGMHETDMCVPDVKFEVLGAPYSLLSVSLPASSTLYSRRGTLVGVNGKVENAISTLSLLEPFRRALLRIPFLYQKITSTSPITCLISTNSPNTTFGVIELDGKADWMVTQKDALLAWTGHSISVTPTINRKMSLAHWGNSKLVGRGLVALVGRGQIYQITLKPGEEFIVHPSTLLAYSITSKHPLPYRLRSIPFRLQVPRLDLSRVFPKSNFLEAMKNTATYKTIVEILYRLKTWARRTLIGDHLFIRFQGPGTILVQSRAARITDVLNKEDVNEMAEVAPGALSQIADTAAKHEIDFDRAIVHKPAGRSTGPPSGMRPSHLKVVIVGKDGKVEFQDSDFKEFTK